jgi:hypothetical protein
MSRPEGLNMGWVVTFTRTWVTGQRPVKVSVIVERSPHPRVFTADVIAARLISRACMLFRCKPQELRLSRHPADGPIFRSWSDISNGLHYR